MHFTNVAHQCSSAEDLVCPTVQLLNVSLCKIQNIVKNSNFDLFYGNSPGTGTTIDLFYGNSSETERIKGNSI